MTSSNFEQQIFETLNNWVHNGTHDYLEVRTQPEFTEKCYANHLAKPDLFIYNKDNGKALAIEIKSVSQEVPLGVYPQLKAMRDAFCERGNDFIVLSNKPASQTLSNNMALSGISLIPVEDSQRVVEAIQGHLAALE